MINALLLAALLVASPASNSMNSKPKASQSGDMALQSLLRSYVVEFLRRNPTVNTYLGGAGLDASLKAVDGRLRDHSATALRDEDRWLTSTMRSIGHCWSPVST